MYEEPNVRGEAPTGANQPLNNEERSPQAARDVAPGKPWVFVEHRTLAEVIATERQQ